MLKKFHKVSHLAFTLSLIILVMLFGSQTTVNAYYDCCMQTNIDPDIGLLIKKMQCPNNPNLKCNTRRTWFNAVEFCDKGLPCGNKIWFCRPTINDDYVIYQVDGCGSDNMITIVWREWKTYHCIHPPLEHFCFDVCDDLAKASHLDWECPDC